MARAPAAAHEPRAPRVAAACPVCPASRLQARGVVQTACWKNDDRFVGSARRVYSTKRGEEYADRDVAGRQFQRITPPDKFNEPIAARPRARRCRISTAANCGMNLATCRQIATVGLGDQRMRQVKTVAARRARGCKRPYRRDRRQRMSTSQPPNDGVERHLTRVGKITIGTPSHCNRRCKEKAVSLCRKR